MSPTPTHHSSTHNQSSHTMPSQTLHTPSPLHNRHSLLMDDVSSEPKGLDGREPTKNKKGGSGKSSVNGGISGLTSGSESSQDDDEDDDADEEDGEKPAVDSPAEQSSPAGPSKKRRYETSSQVDELEYPRKKTAKKIATNTQGILAYEEKTDDDNDIYGNMLDDDDDDCGTCSEAEEAGMAEEFAMDDDILRELGIITDTMPADNNAMPLLPSTDLSFMFDDNGEPVQSDPFNNLFDDLDGEIFEAMHRDPERFNDIPAQSNFDWSSFGLSNDADLFSVHPTPMATPDATPRASISAASGYTAASASGNDSSSSSEDEDVGLSPFFEKGGAALKNLVSTERGNWTDGTDDDADLVKFFFSSADETNSPAESDEETDDETDDDDDLTDVEDNLPIPVPPSKSKLRRASQPSGTRPQIVDLNDNGPELCSWVADPLRPICVVEGDKQTFLIPRSGVDYMGNDSASEWAAVDDSESEQSMPAFDPAFAGLLNLGDASGLSGLNFDISDAFLNFQEGDGDMTDIYSGEDCGLDDYEAGLDIDAFLDISTDEEANREHGTSEAEQGDFDDEECGPVATNQDAFDLWGKVGVTAFRKRQIQHTQKHSALHGAGYNKGKDIPDTITPKKKQKRVRQRFLTSNNSAAQKPSKP